jgi:hypothetical protein
MATRMQQRRGTANQWISTNQGDGPILSPGEIGFESDTNKFKIGDGVNHWVDLTYFTDADSITSALNSIVDGAPAALNTLNELAQALGDDANFLSSLATQTYVTTAIGNIDALPSQTGNAGEFLTTDGTTASWATVDLTSKQDVVSGVSSTEIGYLDGVTSAIQTQLNDKLDSSDLVGLATETYVDTAVGNVTVDLSTAAGTGLDWTGTQFEVDTATVFANPTISSGLTLDGTGDFTVSADANIVLDATTEVYIGSAASGNEVATKSYADAPAAAIVGSAPETLNTLNELAEAINDDASYAATITTALGTKAPLESPTFTGTVDFTGATVNGLPTGPSDGTTSTASTGFGYMGIPQSSASGSGAYSVVASDAGEHIYTTTTRTITIPSNASLALPIGTALTFIAGAGATATIEITTDTMYLAGPGTTGSRTLAPHGMATAVKVAATTWYISGNGLT